MRTNAHEHDVIEAMTPQRRVVLEVIRRSDAHLTANEIFANARELLPTISYATVYNSLRHLKKAGMVAEINFGNGASRYDRETSRHDHAMCSVCAKLVDLDLPATVDLTREAARRCDFKPESIHLTLIGICPECRDTERAPA